MPFECNKIKHLSVCVYCCVSYSAWTSHHFCIVLSSLSSLALPYFFTPSDKQQNFMKCVFFLYNSCLDHLSFFKEFSKISWIHVGVHVKYPLFMKIHPVQLELFRWMGRHESNCHLSQVCKWTLKTVLWTEVYNRRIRG